MFLADAVLRQASECESASYSQHSLPREQNLHTYCCRTSATQRLMDESCPAQSKPESRNEKVFLPERLLWQVIQGVDNHAIKAMFQSNRLLRDVILRYHENIQVAVKLGAAQQAGVAALQRATATAINDNKSSIHLVLHGSDLGWDALQQHFVDLLQQVPQVSDLAKVTIKNMTVDMNTPLFKEVVLSNLVSVELCDVQLYSSSSSTCVPKVTLPSLQQLKLHECSLYGSQPAQCPLWMPTLAKLSMTSCSGALVRMLMSNCCSPQHLTSITYVCTAHHTDATDAVVDALPQYQKLTDVALLTCVDESGIEALLALPELKNVHLQTLSLYEDLSHHKPLWNLTIGLKSVDDSWIQGVLWLPKPPEKPNVMSAPVIKLKHISQEMVQNLIAAKQSLFWPTGVSRCLRVTEQLSSAAVVALLPVIDQIQFHDSSSGKSWASTQGLTVISHILAAAARGRDIALLNSNIVRAAMGNFAALPVLCTHNCHNLPRDCGSRTIIGPKPSLLNINFDQQNAINKETACRLACEVFNILVLWWGFNPEDEEHVAAVRSAKAQLEAWFQRAQKTADLSNNMQQLQSVTRLWLVNQRPLCVYDVLQALKDLFGVQMVDMDEVLPEVEKGYVVRCRGMYPRYVETSTGDDKRCACFKEAQRTAR